jgi:hypothetical protein
MFSMSFVTNHMQCLSFTAVPFVNQKFTSKKMPNVPIKAQIKPTFIFELVQMIFNPGRYYGFN